jgi:hypothetical protein
MPSLRRLRPRNDFLALQWPLLLDILEDEGAVGITDPNPELLEVWARSFRARDHTVGFVESLRAPMLEGLRDALELSFPELPRDARADASYLPPTLFPLRQEKPVDASTVTKSRAAAVAASPRSSRTPGPDEPGGWFRSRCSFPTSP